MVSKLVKWQNRRQVNQISQTPSTIFKLRKIQSYCQRSQTINLLFVISLIILFIIAGILTVCLTTPKPNTICQRKFHRTMKSSLVSSSQPRSLALAHLNNDHQIDFVVANSGTNTIGIFIAQSNGTFIEQQTYSTGSHSKPYSLAICDFNNDTYPDIVVANYANNNIGIFLGYGNGYFTNQTSFSLGSSHPLFVTVVDLNNDHRMDIVVANNGTNNIGILFGYGNGSFQDQITYSTGYDSMPQSIAVGDLNKDNQLDIVVVNYGTNNIGIFFGNGNGTFTNQITYSTFPKSNPSSVALGDFNNDNEIDIVVANSGTGNIGIFINDQNGSFLSQVIYSIGMNTHPEYIAVGDFNKDNQLDIAVSDPENDEIYVIRGYGNGTFSSITTYDGISDSHPMCIVIGDINNNNQSDVIVANYGTNNVLILIDYYVKPSIRQKDYYMPTTFPIVPVAVSDFNNDHIIDIVITTYESIYVLIGKGDGTFDKEISYIAVNNYGIQCISIGDLNNDSRMDIVTANIDSSSVNVVLGKGDGDFRNPITYSTGNGSTPWWVTLADINNDHVLDIISANSGSNTIGILFGNGNGTFISVRTYSTNIGQVPNSVAIGDINNDNYLDLVVACDNNYLVIFLGFGNGDFIISNILYTGKRAASFVVILADFNNDKYLDITVSNTFANNIGVLLGYGNGTFTQQTVYPTGVSSQPYYVIVNDFNHDNISDIAATNLGTDEVIVLYGNGNGTFELSRRYSTGYGSKPYGIVAADLDNNTKLEFIVALWGTPGHFAILTEYDAAEFMKQITSSTGSSSQSYSVAVGDFNNDHQPDIVVANSGTDSLTILLASTNATFDREIPYPIGTDYHPQYVITCDVNKDNQLDLISANSKNDSISVIIGYGNGSFGEQLVYSTGDGSYPIAIASGYINNDTYVDLVVVNEGTDTIGIFYGFDYREFYNQKVYSVGDSLVIGDVIVSDFNNDHCLDILAIFFTSSEIGVLFGYGNGSFMPMITYSTGQYSNPFRIALGDFNNDNQTDIVVTDYGLGTIGVILGYGNGSFAPILRYSTGYNSKPTGIAVNDFNNDSQLDIVVANYGADNVGIFLGYGNGSFSVVDTYSTGLKSLPRSITTGDMNNDGHIDIIVANYGTYNIGIFYGHGNGTFDQAVYYFVLSDAKLIWVSVSDLNNDNRLDIIVALYNSNRVAIFFGNEKGTLTFPILYSTGSGSTPICVVTDDFNSDNILDIAVVNYGTNEFVVLFGVGDGIFLLGKPFSTGSGSRPNALAIGDFNNDSLPDVVVANNYANNIGVFLAHSIEPFGTMAAFNIDVGSKPHSVAIGDLNNDGSSDIIFTSYGTNNVGILFGHGNGTFDLIIRYPTRNGSAPYSVAITDINNDHHLDFVVTNSDANTITIFLGSTNGTFKVGMTYLTGTLSRPYAIAVADLNNDALSDIIVANSGTSSLYFLYGYGNGTFGNGTFYPLGYGYFPYSIAVKDLNEDGWMDIVAECYGTDHIEILIQTC